MTAAIACRWCGSGAGEVVLDLGSQPASDVFPLPADPPAAVHPLRLWLCASCRLAQLPDSSPVPDEPRAVEPAALVAHARESVQWALDQELLVPGTSVREFGSPHGGSWSQWLAEAGLRVVGEGPADVVVDVFGLMHDADQRAGLQQRVAALAPGGLLVLVFPPLETVVAHGQWNAVRHGHHTYPSTAVAAAQLAECGLTVVATTLHPLYGGTRLLAARRGPATPGVGELPAVSAAELRALADGVQRSVTALRAHLQRLASAGDRVLGYGAASRAVPLLVAAGIGPDLLPGVADASAAKQGRLLPGVGIPVISPDDLVAAGPDEVLLFLPDLLAEVRAALPAVEASGGRWFSVETLLTEGDLA
jgi:hypothetical protein